MANIYIFIALIFVIGLWSRPDDNQLEDLVEEEEKTYIPSMSDIQGFMRDFFYKYVYYIACLLFYSAVLILLRSYYGDINIPVVLLFLNTLVLGLYFIEHKFQVFQDFIRVNVVLVSLYYIGRHIMYIAGFFEEVSFIDFVNIVYVFILFFILLYSSKGKKYYSILSHYFIAFSFLEIVVFYRLFLGGELFSTGVLAGMIGMFFLTFTDHIKHLLMLPLQLIRSWGVLLVSAFICITGLYIGNENGYVLFLIPVLGISSYLLILFHERFQNYVALLFSCISVILLCIGLYTFILPENIEKNFFTLFYFIFSFLFLFVGAFYRFRYEGERYFFHIFSILVNILCVLCFFLFRDFSILSLGILLLGESLYLFVSYYTFRNPISLG